jgi:hypothetical protein
MFLCARCGASFSGEAACARCGLEFRTFGRARRWSILLPGGGYFYTGHPWLGLGDAIVEAMLMLFVLLSLLGASEGTPGSWPVVAVFAVILVLEKLITIYHARHYVAEALPADRVWKPGPATFEPR